MKLITDSFLISLFIIGVGISSVHAQLLVSDRTTGQVTKYDASTGEFEGVLIPGDPSTNGGLIAPTSMTLGPDGDLFVAGMFGLNPDGTGNVLRYDADSGEFLGTFAEGLFGPSGLHYSAEKDEIYVSTFGNFDSELVFRYQASTGELLSTFGEGTGPTGRTAIDTGPDGNLYVGAFGINEFFTGAILQFDGETQAPQGPFAVEPLLSGANNFTFRDGDADNTFQLDLVGLFSNNVARFDIADEGGQLSITGQEVLIVDELDFPSALIDLDDGSMLVSSLGNDNPQTGDLRPGSIARFDVTTGDFLGTFIGAGGEGSLAQPTAMLLLPSEFDPCSAGLDQRDQMLAAEGLILGDFDADGEVAFPDFLILSNGFGGEGTYADGDATCDGMIEFDDFLALSSTFGLSSNVQAVPEPNSTVLAALLGFLSVCFRKRR